MIRLPILFMVSGALFLAGCQSGTRSQMDQPMVARFFLEATQGSPGLTVKLPVSAAALKVNPKPVLTEYDIVSATFAKVELGWCLYFQFSQAAARDLYRLSAANQGARLVLTLNDLPVGARRLDQPISDGGLLIFVELSDEDLPPIVERIRRTTEKLNQQGR